MPKILDNEQIYRAVIKVVSERGYSGATTKQMADAANVSEVTLFRKYGSKQQLVRQAISSIINQSDLASSAEYTGDISADLFRIVQAYQDSAVKHGNFVNSLILEMSQHPELVDSVEAPKNIFLAIGKLISRYQDEGVLKKNPPLHTLAVLLGPLMYAALVGKLIPKSHLPTFDLKNHVACFLEGHCNNPD